MTSNELTTVLTAFAVGMIVGVGIVPHIFVAMESMARFAAEHEDNE